MSAVDVSPSICAMCTYKHAGCTENFVVLIATCYNRSLLHAAVAYEFPCYWLQPGEKVGTGGGNFFLFHDMLTYTTTHENKMTH